MRRTSILSLVIFAVIGVAVGFVLDQLLTVLRMPTFTPSTLLPIMLLLLAAGVIALAWPVRRSVQKGIRIDPFRAVRVATLARAASLLGALMAGFGGGLAIFLATRPVPAQVGSMTVMVALMGSAAVLVAAALIAEWFCTLPKDYDEPSPDEPDTELEH